MCPAGKGDLVGSDVDMHLRNGPDTVVKSSCDVKALTYCDLKSIFIPGLMEVLKMYLEYQQEFANDIKHDLTYNLREGYDSEVSCTRGVSHIALSACLHPNKQTADNIHNPF